MDHNHGSNGKLAANAVEVLFVPSQLQCASELPASCQHFVTNLDCRLSSSLGFNFGRPQTGFTLFVGEGDTTKLLKDHSKADGKSKPLSSTYILVSLVTWVFAMTNCSPCSRTPLQRTQLKNVCYASEQFPKVRFKMPYSNAFCLYSNPPKMPPRFQHYLYVGEQQDLYFTIFFKAAKSSFLSTQF